MRDLLQQEGSFRRVCEKYWLGQYTPDQERLVEESTPKETLAGFKPIVVDSICLTCRNEYQAVPA